MIKLKRLLTEAWPKWSNLYSQGDSSLKFHLAIGDDDPDPAYNKPSWFVEAGLTFNALENEMAKLGCIKETKDYGQYMQWDNWLASTGLGSYVARVEASSKSKFDKWNKNVVANNKSATWKTPDGQTLLHASTIETFLSWLERGEEGLIIKICKFDTKSGTGGMNSCVDHYLWNINDTVRITTK